MSSVIKNWILELSHKQQATLLMVIRNCDIIISDDPSRLLINEFRKVIFRSTFPVADIDDYIPSENIDRDFRKMINKVIINANSYPLNFYKSIIQASAIIGYKHPEFKIRKRWFDVYVKLAQKLNLQIETVEDIDFRLSD